MYLTYFAKCLKVNFNYRAEIIFRFIFSAMYFSITLCIWSSLYNGKTEVAGATLAKMITFSAISAIISALTNNGLAKNIATKIESGLVGIDFIRPIKIKSFYIIEELAAALNRVLIQAVPVVIMISLFYRDAIYFDYKTVIPFLVSLILGVIILYQTFYILGLFTFWLKKSTYIDWIVGGIYSLFSGGFVPIWLFPNWLNYISWFFPFRYITYEAIAIYVGITTVNDYWKIYLIQAFWLFILFIAERYIWRSASKVITIQGG